MPNAPDLSPAALALALRQEATVHKVLAETDADDGFPHLSRQHRQRAAYLESLADALEGEGMTWEDRRDAANGAFWRAVESGEPCNDAHITIHQADRYMGLALRAAFPEFAPEAD